MSAYKEPCISFRRSIRWGPNLESKSREEPTSTLVLTTPSSHFIDIRLSLPPSFDSSPATLQTTSPTSLSWAFAGTSESGPLPANSLPTNPLPATSSPPNASSSTNPTPTTWGRWTHWIDTHHKSGYQDSGLMATLPSGNTIETGSMVNPETGLVADFEEIWDDSVPPESNDTVVCLMLDEEKDGKVRRGMVVRVGPWIQGLLIIEAGGEKGDNGVGKREIVLERWVREDNLPFCGGLLNVNWKWKRLVRIYTDGNGAGEGEDGGERWTEDSGETLPCMATAGKVVPEDRLGGWKVVPQPEKPGKGKATGKDSA